MAGDAITVKRAWGIGDGSSGSGNYIDPFRAIFDEHNKIVTDLETLRTALQGLIDANLDGDGAVVSALPGIAIGTSAATAIKITNAFTIMVQGVPVSVSAQEVALTATTHDIADPDSDPREAYFLLSTDSQGNVTVTKGADAAADAAVYPDVPAGEVAFGAVLIQHDGTAIFNASTNDLDAAHLTSTFSDLAQVVSSDVAAAALTAAQINTVEPGD